VATIHDVADKAGVSIKTVSRVMNGTVAVSDKTRRRVEQAIAALEFAPSAAARSLRGVPAGLVAVIADKITTTPDSFEIIKGIQQVCEQQGKILLIGEAGGNPETIHSLIGSFREHRVEAILFATQSHRQVVIEPLFGNTPVALANCYEPDPRFMQIVPDDEGGGYEAARIVLEAGHREIAFLQLVPGMDATELRQRGFQRAMREYGAVPNPAWMLHGAETTSGDEFAHLSDALDRLFEGDRRPTAILCGNDKMAMRVIFLLQSRQLRVPEQVSVVGFDDFRLISEALHPGLTTVSLPYREIGEMSARYALDGGAREAVTVRVPCRPVQRGTVAAPPAERA
jgi:LacI family transcriptional regulator